MTVNWRGAAKLPPILVPRTKVSQHKRFISNDINHFLWSVDLTLRISLYFDSKLFKISQVSPKIGFRFFFFFSENYWGQNGATVGF